METVILTLSGVLSASTMIVKRHISVWAMRALHSKFTGREKPALE